MCQAYLSCGLATFWVVVGIGEVEFEIDGSKVHHHEFPVGCEASLNDFLNWLAQWITKPNTEVRHKAMEIIYHLSPNVKSLLQVDELRSYIANEIKDVSGTMDDMERIIACLEISRWLVDQRVVSFDHLGIDFEATLTKVLRVNDFNATKDP